MQHPIALLVLLVSSCAVPPANRPTSTLDSGRFYVGGFAGGDLSGEMRPDLIPPEAMANFGVTTRLGVGAGCEVGATLSFLRQELDARCGLLRIASGSPLSISPVVSAAYLPARGLEARGGIDFAVNIGRVKPIFHLGASHGSRLFFFQSSRFDEESNLIATSPSNYDYDTRIETRVDSSVGFAVTISAHTELSLAVQPYWTIAGGDTPAPSFPVVDSTPTGAALSFGGGYHF